MRLPGLCTGYRARLAALLTHREYNALSVGAVTGSVHRMEYRLVPILHPLHAIAGMILLPDKVFCAIAERQVPEPGAFTGYRARAALSVLSRQKR